MLAGYRNLFHLGCLHRSVGPGNIIVVDPQARRNDSVGDIEAKYVLIVSACIEHHFHLFSQISQRFWRWNGRPPTKPECELHYQKGVSTDTWDAHRCEPSNKEGLC